MAKAFTFRFETLLRLRRQVEDEKKRVVAARLRRIHSVQERQALLETRISEQTQAIRESLKSDAMDLDNLRLGRHWLSGLRRGVLEAQSELTAHRAMLAQERAVLSNARKDSEIITRLREKQREQHVTEMNRLEQIEQDEMSVLRFAEAMREGATER
jgi:flagellar export protein FliJ